MNLDHPTPGMRRVQEFYDVGRAHSTGRLQYRIDDHPVTATRTVAERQNRQRMFIEANLAVQEHEDGGLRFAFAGQYHPGRQSDATSPAMTLVLVVDVPHTCGMQAGCMPSPSGHKPR